MSNQNEETLSVCIITKNEADRVEHCLRSVASVADEVIVIDSGSTDGTVDVVKKYTPQVWVTDWPGFGIQKQRALDKATSTWILFLDADEALDETAQSAIQAIKARPSKDIFGYRIPFLTVRYGKILRFGRKPGSLVRLYRREGASYRPEAVHEKLQYPEGSQFADLTGHVLHTPTRHHGHELEKGAKYAWWGSQRYFKRGKRSSSLVLIVLRAMWTFFVSYLVRGGVLDGKVGFVVAALHAQGNFNKHLGLWLLTQQEKGKLKYDGAITKGQEDKPIP